MSLCHLASSLEMKLATAEMFERMGESRAIKKQESVGRSNDLAVRDCEGTNEGYTKGVTSDPEYPPTSTRQIQALSSASSANAISASCAIAAKSSYSSSALRLRRASAESRLISRLSFPTSGSASAANPAPYHLNPPSTRINGTNCAKSTQN